MILIFSSKLFNLSWYIPSKFLQNFYFPVSLVFPKNIYKIFIKFFRIRFQLTTVGFCKHFSKIFLNFILWSLYSIRVSDIRHIEGRFVTNSVSIISSSVTYSYSDGEKSIFSHNRFWDQVKVTK